MPRATFHATIIGFSLILAKLAAPTDANAALVTMLSEGWLTHYQVCTREFHLERDCGSGIELPTSEGSTDGDAIPDTSFARWMETETEFALFTADVGSTILAPSDDYFSYSAFFSYSVFTSVGTADGWALAGGGIEFFGLIFEVHNDVLLHFSYSGPSLSGDFGNDMGLPDSMSAPLSFSTALDPGTFMLDYSNPLALDIAVDSSNSPAAGVDFRSSTSLFQFSFVQRRTVPEAHLFVLFLTSLALMGLIRRTRHREVRATDR